MSIAKVACYLETSNVRVCAHSPIESLLGKERNATTSHFVSDYGAARILECERASQSNKVYIYDVRYSSRGLQRVC